MPDDGAAGRVRSKTGDATIDASRSSPGLFHYALGLHVCGGDLFVLAAKYRIG
jgi:hypothetical protein